MGKRVLRSHGGKKNPISSSKKKSQKRKQVPVSRFHASDYSTTELRSISKGGRPEAYRASMRRSDVPKGVKDKAKTELRKRKKRKRK